MRFPLLPMWKVDSITELTPEILEEKGIIRAFQKPITILGVLSVKQGICECKGVGLYRGAGDEGDILLRNGISAV